MPHYIDPEHHLKCWKLPASGSSISPLYLIKEDLADIRGEMAQGSKRFAEDFQEAVLHCEQCFLLCCL